VCASAEATSTTGTATWLGSVPSLLVWHLVIAVGCPSSKDATGGASVLALDQGGLRYSPVMPDTPSSPPSSGPLGDPDKLRQRERTFPIQHHDWFKLRQNVADLKEPVPYLASVGWACAGLTAGALLGLLAWLPVNSALPVKARVHYSFITPLLIITAVAGIVIVTFTFAVWHQLKQMRLTSVRNVLDEMDAIYEPYSHNKVLGLFS